MIKLPLKLSNKTNILKVFRNENIEIGNIIINDDLFNENNKNELIEVFIHTLINHSNKEIIISLINNENNLLHEKAILVLKSIE